jgi:hypothetical protein
VFCTEAQQSFELGVGADCVVIAPPEICTEITFTPTIKLSV